jgi:diguanylate cyclase (GGDEF)-like protein/PAS domain S-box-containing protein
MEPPLIEVGVGHSQAPDSFAAGAQAAAAARATVARHAPSCTLVYTSSRYDPEQALAGIHSVMGEVPTIGATTAGEIANGSARDGIAVLVLASPFVKVHCAVGHGVSRDWRNAVDELLAAVPLRRHFDGSGEALQAFTREGKSLFALLHFPGNTRAHVSQGYEIVERIKARSFGRIPIIGGAAADDWKMQGNAVLMGGQAHADSVLLAVFETELQFGIALTHGFRASARRAIVTAAADHELVCLDGQPAAEVLSRLLDSSPEALQGKHVTLTTGRTIGTVDAMGNFSTHVAAYFTPRGGVSVTQPLPVGETIFVMVPETESMLRAGPEAISQAIGRGGIGDPAVAVVHHCALRPRLLGDAPADEIEALRGVLPGVPLAGFHSFGEVGLGPDGVSRHGNAAIAVLALGRDFSLGAKIARENRRLRHEAEQQAQSLREINRSLEAEITERKRSEQALQRLRDELEHTVAARTGELERSNEALRHQLGFTNQLIEGLPGSFYLVDDSGRLRLWNSRFMRISGYAAEELDGKPALEFFTGDDKTLIASRIAKVFADGEAEAEAELVTKDGRQLPYHFTGQRVILDERPCLIGLGIDISDRRQRETRDHIRNRVFELLVGDGSLPEILARVVDYVESTTPELLCSILLPDECGRLRVGAAPRLPAHYNDAIDGAAIGNDIGSCGTAAYRGERVIVEDIAGHPYWRDYRELAASAGVASCWSEPIRDSTGKVLGTFAIYRREPHSPDEAEIELVSQAAMLARIAIERRHLDAELQLASSVYRASAEAIVVTDSANRILAVNPAFTRVTGYAAAEVLGRNPKLLSSGRTPREQYEAMWQSLATTGQWQGEISNQRKDATEYVEWLTINAIHDEAGAVHRYIAMFSDITEKKRIEELVWLQANYDTQTGLPNRRLFRDRLQQELARLRGSDRSLALLFIDLDRFKEVNDTLGHAVGDLLLTQAARRIAACVRQSDTVARLGGDEFTVVLPSLVGTARIEAVAQAILSALAEPFHLDNQVAYVSASIGITLYPTDAGDIEALLKNADQAMYVAKAQGRNCFSYFTEYMQQSAQTRMAMSNDLRGALKNGQFELHFQPIVELPSGRIVKAEALLRWRHPQHGLIPPARFIPLAEDSGMIHEIGDWVFREATSAAKRWCCTARPIQISVNKSPRQFFSGNSHEAWIAHLAEIGLPPQCLAIEITEGLLLDERPDIAERLACFREAGIEVAIDDFGTGYSAMAYLKKFSIDYLKIDRSFVRDMAATAGDRVIVEAIIVMAHKLGLRVIAEGIEDAAQRKLLTAAGCDYGQGYFFARPLPAQEFESLLAVQS